MDGVKRVLAGIFLLGLASAGVYGFLATERERSYRQLIATGDAALATDNSFAAIEAFSGAIALKSDAMVGYLKRGQAYHRRGEFAAAVRDLRRASDLDPSATRPLEELGDVYLADSPHHYAEAAACYATYIRLDNRAPRVLYKLAFARYNDGHAADAIEPLQNAIALDDRFPEAYYLLGLCHRDAKHPDAALQSLEKSVALQPALLHAREQLADLYGSIGRTDSRLAQLAALSALDPGPSREVTLGLAYARAGHFDQAVLTLFGRALLLTSDAESAEHMLQDAALKRPVDPLAYFYLADAAERLGHYTVAREALLDYTVLAGDEPDARRRSAQTARLGDLSLRANDPAGAAAYFLRAANDSGSDPTLLARAADAQLRAGDPDTARATVANALEKDPQNALAIAVAQRLIPVRRPGSS